LKISVFFKGNKFTIRVFQKQFQDLQQEDGSVIVRIIKQYNQSPVGSYLD